MSDSSGTASDTGRHFDNVDVDVSFYTIAPTTSPAPTATPAPTAAPTRAPTAAPTQTRLLACNFDSSDVCGFDYTADYDWTRSSYGTPSWGTGPSGDHTSGTGYYMYAVSYTHLTLPTILLV